MLPLELEAADKTIRNCEGPTKTSPRVVLQINHRILRAEHAKRDGNSGPGPAPDFGNFACEADVI